MTNDQTTAAVSKVLRCEHCTSTFRNVVWSEGARCPRCRSPRYSPLPVLGRAVDYALADRAQGYAVEDIRFAKIAQWAGFITSGQYQEAFNRQNEYVSAGGAVPTIGDVLIKMKALSPLQVEFVLEYRCRERPNMEEAGFARLAVQGKLCTEARIEECEKAQVAEKKLGHDPPPLACVLYEKRYMQENQIQAVLQKQFEAETGLAWDARRFVEENTVKPAERLLGLKGTPERKKRVAVASMLAVALLFVGGRQLASARAAFVATLCTNQTCSTRSGMPYNTNWPARCPVCRNDPPTVYPLAICEFCAELHVVQDRTLPAVCSKCGVRDRVVYITSDAQEHEIRRRAAERE